MKAMEKIAQVKILEESDKYIASILMGSGDTQEPTWRGLQKYWRYAKQAEIEYVASSYINGLFVLCCLVASGQGGIVAIWDTSKKRWLHVSESNFVSCALMLEEKNVLISFHYVSSWGVRGHHRIYQTPITGVKDGFAEISTQINTQYENTGFNPDEHKISQAALGDSRATEFGPLGIFYAQDEGVIYAHDAGNLYTFYANST